MGERVSAGPLKRVLALGGAVFLLKRSDGAEVADSPVFHGVTRQNLPPGRCECGVL